MSVKKKILILSFTIVAAMLATGCLSISADELYRVPEVSAEYIRLQAQINMLQNQGAEFSPPIGGPNRQAVQLRDLNGTGTNEVIAFFSIPGQSTLQVYIFELVDGDYTVTDIIHGAGTDIESVRYVDMDGSGTKQLVIGWQMGPALRYMSIYSLSGLHSQVLVSGVEYSDIAVYDITGDGFDDVIVFMLPTQEMGAIAEVYSLMQDGEIIKTAARLSSGIESISRIQTGKLLDGVPAIFVDSEGTFAGGGLVTDILVIFDNSLSNISLVAASGVSETTVRNRMSSSDINRDSIVKIPYLRLLIAQSDTDYFAIDWYAFTSSGQSRRILTTYHNNFDEWFLILPDDWREKVSVRREDSVPGQRTIIFSYFGDGDGSHEDFLEVMKLSGDNAREKAQQDGRVLLLSEGAAAYSFKILAPPDSFGLTFNEEVIRANFRLIYSDWLTGRGT